MLKSLCCGIIYIRPYSPTDLSTFKPVLIFIQVKLCLTTATHNLKLLTITRICTFANFDVWRMIQLQDAHARDGQV